MDNLKKEKWIEETLASLDRAERAAAPVGLFEKAMLRAQKPAARVVKLSIAQVRAAAACLVLLAVANVFAAVTFSKNKISQKSAASSVERAYFDFALTPEF